MIKSGVKAFFFLCALNLLFSCNTTNTSGIGLTTPPPKPPINPIVNDLTAKITDTYKSTLSIPEVGFSKTVEFTDSLRLSSDVYCNYLIQESSTLLEKDKIVLIDVQYKQTADEENRPPCPEKRDKYVNHKKSLAFEKYSYSKIALFMLSADVETFLKTNPEFKTAQVLTMDSRKLGAIDTLFVRLKIVGLNNESYLLETHFSSMNSFLDIVDQKYISMSNSEVISYHKLLIPSNFEMHLK